MSTLSQAIVMGSDEDREQVSIDLFKLCYWLFVQVRQKKWTNKEKKKNSFLKYRNNKLFLQFQLIAKVANMKERMPVNKVRGIFYFFLNIIIIFYL